MSIEQSLLTIVAAFQERQPMRAKSLIITVFGDVISQHGHTIWLSSLARALEPLGVSDRLVRTSVFRLVKEGWLDVEKIGRKSFYGFSDFGAIEYQRAAKRIYALDNQAWRGGWQLLLTTDIPDRQRESVRRSLNWLGFRPVTSGVFARPGDSSTELKELLEEFDLDKRVIIMDATASPITAKKHLKETVSTHWSLDELAQEYDQLIQRYRQLRKLFDRGVTAEPQEAFQARILMIHDYRRILLRDTPLPDDLLPSRWPGTTARQLVASLYRELSAPSIAFIKSTLESEQGLLQEPVHNFYARFQD